MTKIKTSWKPWHQVVALRDDVRNGELSMATFAADVYDVLMGNAKKVYQEPAEFFALTYPTLNLRNLAKDVCERLSGKSDKAIRQLELTYGGGKTHTLITLLHLVSNPTKLPADLPAVQEFVQHIGFTPPKTRVAVMPFDKLDVEKGMLVKGPKGETRQLKQPWSVLAFQLAGVDGLKILHADNKDAERDSAPAEPLLVEVLSYPAKQDLATLVLLDEVLMYAREKVGLDPAWLSRLTNFFQYLTQAAIKVERCAIVASLLATDPRKSDRIGKEITQELSTILGRGREEGVQPVTKEDVAEVLRRRFFTPDSIRDREGFRPHVVAALNGIAALDKPTADNRKAEEDRYLKSFPFHPDVTEVLYGKWTGLENFQRTRGVLRTFALGLRDAEKWDVCPLVGPNIFLSEPGRKDLSAAARELTSVAATEEYDGKRQEWTAIIEGELTKACEIQTETPGLICREVEQGVMAVFLHSQPIGQKALTREMLLLLGSGRPDKIELAKALRSWAGTSWYLDEGFIGDGEPGPDGKAFPKAWRLGGRPNLTQMHHDACLRVSAEQIEAVLLLQIEKAKSLTTGASGAGARVHVLPDKPSDIQDDGDFHYAVLGPKAASDSGKPSADAKRFLDETTSADRPRVYRNAVVLAAPSHPGLDAARLRIREYIGWEGVRDQLKNQELDPIRQGNLAASLDTSRKRIPDAVQQAYCIVVTVSEKNEPHAFKLTLNSEPLFTQVKADVRARITDTAVSADALMPGGPYDLWREGEVSRRVKDLVGAFAQFPHLPKMLAGRAILDTLIAGCKGGQFVLRTVRPDKTGRTFWRVEPGEAEVKDPSLEVVLPESASLAELPAALLSPGTLPGLWSDGGLRYADLTAFFSGRHVVKVPKEGWEEPLPVPRAEGAVLGSAVAQAVKDGLVWLVAGAASVFAEELPAGLLTDNAVLLAAPAALSTTGLLPDTLPEAWSGETTTASALAAALSKRAGKPLPWVVISRAIDGAFHSHLLERTPDSAKWPSDYAGAGSVKIRLPAQPVPMPETTPRPTTTVTPQSTGVLVAESDLETAQFQELSDLLGEIGTVAATYGLKLHLRMELGGAKKPTPEAAAKINDLLKQVADGLAFR